MSNERIDIEVREDGSRVVKRNLEDMAREAERTAASVDLMQSALRTIQGTVKQPISSLQQMRSALQALQSAAKSPGGLLDNNNINFATAALDRLRQATVQFAKEAPSNVQAAVGRINLGMGTLEQQIIKTKQAQQDLINAQQAAAKMPKYTPPVQQGFGFMQEPMKISGAGWQLEGQFKAVATGAQQAAGTIASLAAPTQQFSNVAKTAATSAQQLNLNLGAANQTSFAFMQGMAAQVAPVNQLAQQYQTVGTVWSKNTKQAQQLQFGFMNAAGGASAAGKAAASAIGPVNSLSESFLNMRNVLKGFGAYLFLREIKEYIDTWIGAQNMIALYTSSAQEAAVVQERLFKTAQDTRQEYGTLAQLYQRTAQAAGNLGASQEEMLQFTRGVGMALAVQNRSSTQAAGALLQLGQLVGMARIRMQEFNSISENMPIVLQIVAKHIDGAGGSIARLRDMIHKGQVSSQDFFRAFNKGSGELEEKFKRLNPTITQAFNVLDNAIGRWIYGTDQAVGASTAFARGVIKLADNVDVLAKAIGSLAAGVIVAALPTLVMRLIGVKATADAAATGIRGMWAALSAHPIAAVVTAILTAITALYLFRDSIYVIKKEGVTLGDVWRAQFQYIADMARSFWEYMKNLWSGGAKDLSKDPIIANMEQKEAWPGESKLKGQMAGQYKQEIGLVEGIMRDFVQMIKDKLNLTIGMWVTITKLVPLLWNNMWAAIKDMTVSAINEQLQRLEDYVNAAVKIYNIVDFIKNPLSHVDLPEINLQLTNENRGRARKLGIDIAKTIVEGMGTDYVGNAAKELLERATNISKSRQFWEAGGLWRPPDLNVPADKLPSPEKKDKEAEKLEDKLNHLRATIDPVWGALHQITQAEELLNKAIEKGIPLWDTKDKILEGVKQHYQDALDPVGAHIRALEQELEMSKLFAAERRGGMDAMRAEQELKKKNPKITQEEIDKIRELNEQIQRNKQFMREVESIYNSTIGAQRRLETGQAALNYAYEKGWISAARFNQEMRQLRIEAGTAGFWDGFLNQLDFLDYKMQDWSRRAGSYLADAMTGAIDAISNALAEAFMKWENFYDILRDLARTVIQQLIASFIKLGIQMVLNFILGKSLAVASVGASVAAASASAAAWATPAALASLATLGTNAVAAEAALISTVAMANGLATGSLVSLEKGGYTGTKGRKEIAGVVHGQEFVMNAEATQKYRGILEAMNRPGTHVVGYGQGGYVGPPTVVPPPSGGAGTPVEFKVNVQNYTPVRIDVDRIGENEIRVIAREEARKTVHREAPVVIAADMENPNGRVSRSLQKNQKAPRRRDG